MSAWRRIALERFPHLRQKLQTVDGLFALWTELSSELYDAYHRRERLAHPLEEDEERMAQVFDFASWCLHHPATTELCQSVVVGFYESLFINKTIRNDLLARLSLEDFNLLVEWNVFRYDFDKEEQYRVWVADFYRQKKFRSQSP